MEAPMKIRRMSCRAAVAAVLVAIAAGAHAQVQDAAQQKCLNGMNAQLAKVAKTQQKEIAACLKAAAAGKLPAGTTAEQCLTADAKGKIAKVVLKSFAAATKLCGTAPDFGLTDPATVNAAGLDETLDLEAALFGVDLSTAVITVAGDKAGAACQAAVTKSAGAVLDASLAAFRACKKAGLKDGSVASVAALAGCLDAVTADATGKIAKNIGLLVSNVGKKCDGIALGTAFPGSCAAAPDFPACVALRARCETCQMATAADALPRDCDLFDDALPNSSCGISCTDADGDGYGAGCAAGPDCDDTRSFVHPGIDEACNGIDDDCSGGIDDAPVDVGLACDVPLPPPAGATSGCQAGITVCNAGVLTCDGSVGPTGVLDGCNVDANCDGALTGQPDLSSDVDNCGTCGHACYAGAVHARFACNGGACQFEGCQQGFYDTDGNTTCEYACSFVSPQEACNGLDDNCNGLIDESVLPPSPQDVCGVSPIATAPECTSEVAVTCNNGAWQCTFPAGVCSPSCAAASDACGPTSNTLDNDCNGYVNDDPTCQSCGSIP
jgi:hypothetical protein